MLGVVFVILFGVYLFYPAYPTMTWRSLGGWTWAVCNSHNGFLHGRLVPLVFPWMIWWAWKSRGGEVVQPSYWGLVLLGVGLLLFLAGMRAEQPRFALFGVPFVVIGLGQYLFGWKVAKGVIFPAFFLWFTIPVPGLERVVMGNWETMVTRVSYEMGDLLGMGLILEGWTIVVGESQMSIAEG